jgi:hypothetical protein
MWFPQERAEKEDRQDTGISENQERAEEVEVVGDQISVGILNVINIKC